MTTVAAEHLEGKETAKRRFWEHGRAVFCPPEDLTGSEWADKYRVISEGNPEPGPWRTDRVPYLREIMDVCTDPSVGDKRVVFMKSARVGGTECGMNVIGYYADQVPSQMLVVQPTKEDAEGFSKEQVKPMIDDTPQLRNRFFPETGRRDSKNTILQKSFPGGFLVMVGSNSASGFRRRNIQRVFLEEVDGYALVARGSSSAAEGDPVTLAVKRTQNYDDRLIYEDSTPTLKGRSRIEYDYNLSDQRRFFVPCPHCGHMQVLKWRNLRWENNDASTVMYTCGDISEQGELTAGCGKSIDEQHKREMLRRGEWRAARPGRKIIGFHVWAAYSPFTSWERLVDEWLNAQGKPELLQVFINTVLGETWEEEGEQVEPDSLKARRVQYTNEVPQGVGVLTAGVDVQGDRLEVSVWGYGKGFESWLIKHETLWGDPAKEEVWEQLDLVRSRAYLGQSAKHKIRCVCVDSGGHHTDEVYRYTRARQRKRVFSIKGSSTPGSAPVGRPTKGNRYKATLFTLGTEALKDTLLSRMKTDVVGPGYLHFPLVDDEYFRQLTSEKAVTRWVNGRPVRRYIKKTDRARGEALDCAVYSLAGLMILGPTVYERLEYWVKQAMPASAENDDLPDEADETGAKADEEKILGKRPKRKRRSGFVDRWRT